jgi:hypothetical protein
MREVNIRKWLLHKWGWLSIVINLAIVILAKLFPMLLGGPPAGELDTTRFEKIPVFIIYPVVSFAESVFRLIYGTHYYREVNDSVVSIVLLVAVIFYWYFLGMFLFMIKSKLSSINRGVKNGSQTSRIGD